MPTSIKFTRDDLENIALKLDELSTILNERERTLLATLFRMVPGSGHHDPPQEQDEPLSAIFLDACHAAMRSGTTKS